MSDLPSNGAGPRLPSMTYGECATASLLIAVLSGVALAIAYDPADALASVAMMQLANPAAAFFRNLHYWSAQGFLVLSLLHAWDHVRRRDARPLRLGAWIRICLSLPAVAFVAWSGFVLKGDTESLQALRVVGAALSDIPVVGGLLAAGLFGREGSLQLIYVHHAATFTFFVWFVLVEHGRLVWPRPAVIAAVLAPAALVSLWISPTLHDGLSAVVKGPWYFVGLQEAFHWSPSPGAVLLASTLPLVALFATRWMTVGGRRATALVLLGTVVGYGVLTLVGWAFRGPNWTWTSGWRSNPPSFVVASILDVPDAAGEPLNGGAVPVVMGRPEGCLACHRAVSGLSPSHDPTVIGCASCHGGNVFSLHARTAHARMRVVPGNLADARVSCGGDCHAGILDRIERSLMSTNAGIVAVNRRAWAESPGGEAHVTRAGFSPADSHLRQLCASCHLAVPKDEPGPIGEQSRGGGCTACHVTYSPDAQRALERYRAARAAGGKAEPPAAHPDVVLPASNAPCFGCHSRSGRVSLSYEGWREVDPAAPVVGGTQRRLGDGRLLVQVLADGHAKKGMLCIDCHTAREVMGDGVRHLRQLDQPHVACDDCHPTDAPRTVLPSQMDEESRRIAGLRKLPIGQKPLLQSTAGDVFVNAFVDIDGSLRMLGKTSAQPLELRRPPPACRDAAHGRVTCIGCHTAWAPRCPTCHTRFDQAGAGYDWVADREVRGEWVESGGGFGASPPTLGVRRLAHGGARRDLIEPFMPGMIATLDPRGVPGGASQPVFRRWYTRAFSHTVTRAGRTCVSCHNDPVALGYGEGRLEFTPAGPGEGRWRFVPARQSLGDGLPADAWIGWMQLPRGSASTRDDVRPFTVEEQQRILEAGACLTCHPGESAVMRRSLNGLDAVVAQRSPRCRRAVWRR